MPLRREELPNKRQCETFSVPWGGLELPHTVTVGFYPDGRVGEVFINAGKSGEMVEAIARDGAVMLSMALQHGVPIDTIAHAITRNGQNEPQTVVGAIVDILAKRVAEDGRGSEAQGLSVSGAAGGVDSGEVDGG